MKKVVSISLLVIIFSCKHREEDKIILQKNEESLEVTSDFDKKELMNKLINLSIEEGDTVSYKKIFRDYVSSGHYNDFICISIKMIEKYSYTRAYYDIYYLLSYGDFEKDFYKEELAYYFLVKAFELNDKNAIDTIEMLDEFEPSNKILLDSEYYRNLILSSENILPCEIISILKKKN
ncbi:hypothetical protein ACFS5J_05755 [Flavobacterium chuncheonense]|uniref:Lipoprotein n=1 Tax=Flavobacterium chuncheonense TaxID=2026653 RepID=A0ABW5YM78_9FLAO